MARSRKITKKILDMVGDGLIDPMELITACLKYMSEDEVADMAAVNDFIPDDEEEDAEDLVDIYEQGAAPDDDDEEDEEDEDDY